MTARHKLNQANFLGIAVVAGAIAALFESWHVFWAAGAILTGTAIHSGNIRWNSKGCRQR